MAEKKNINNSLDNALNDMEENNLEQNANLELLEDNDLNNDQNITNKDLKKFEQAYKKSYKQSIANDGLLKEIDSNYLKKIRNKRNEIISLRKKIDSNNSELEKAFQTFKEVYYQDINDDKILDTKDKALAQKTLLNRKNVRDIDAKLDKMEKDYKESLKDSDEALADYKKSFAQTMMDFDRKMKVEISKSKKSKEEEITKLNFQLSETNNRLQINAINERLANIKKETLADKKDINIKYINLKKDEELKNLNYLLEFDKNLINKEKEYNKSKSTLTFEKRQKELDYEIESKTYILAAKRANNNLKSDLIVRKNGVIKNITDLNDELYKNITIASLELLELQNEYNTNVLDKLVSEYVTRMNLVLTHQHYNVSKIDKDINKLLLKDDSPFVKSLSIMNNCYIENLKRVVNLEYDTLIDYVRNAYYFNSKSDYNYQEINDNVSKYFLDYKQKMLDSLTLLYSASNKINKEVTKKSQEITDSIREMIISRSNLHKELMEKVNKVIINFASSSDEYTMKFKNEVAIKEEYAKESALYYVDEYKNAIEEMEGTKLLYEKNDKLIDEEIESFNKEVEEKKKTLSVEIESSSSVIDNEANKKIEEITLKYEENVSSIETKYKEMLKDLVGDFKTENKLYNK